MTYSKRKFGAELILCLEEGYDIDRIAKWADRVYYDHQKDLDDQLDDIIQNLGSMTFSSQFVYTEKELIDLAVKLITDKYQQEELSKAGRLELVNNVHV